MPETSLRVPDSSIVDQLNSVIAHHAVDEVLVALPIDKYRPLVETIVRHCEEQGIIVRVRTEMFNLQVARSYVDNLQGVPVLTIQSGPSDSWQLIAKRVIDIVVSSGALLLALAPLFALVALLIRLDSPGPILFAQERVGYNKRRFQGIKISDDGS